MSKIQLLDSTYENLTESYINSRNRVGTSILEMAVVCLKAKEQLKKKKFFEWLDDSRIRLKRTQAKKMIAIARSVQGGQLTDLLNKKGIEETYLIAQIEDTAIRNELAEQIIDTDFTVKDTKMAVSIIKTDNKSPIEAIEKVKELKALSKQTSKIPKQVVSIEKYNSLKNEYEKLQIEKQELEKKLAKLSENNSMPVTQETPKTNLNDSIFDENGQHKLSISSSIK